MISVIAWMAGLLYLPRLFVYHTDAEPGSKQSETFKKMERRLYRAIMTPAMVASWFFGLCLVFGQGNYMVGEVWFTGKMMFVGALSVFHVFLGWHVRQFASDLNIKTAGVFRMLNEVPTVLMVVIVIAVIVRPFGSG